MGKSEIDIILPPIERSALGLRDAIFDEIDALGAGKVTPRHAREIANLVRQCIDAARLDLQAKHLTHTMQLGAAKKIGGGE
jgi:hypothetical protein